MTQSKQTPRKQAIRKPRQPTDRQAKADVSRETSVPLGFDVDTAEVLRLLGVEPGMVREGSAKISLIDNKVIIEYSIIRAVPPRMMGMALLAGAASAEDQKEQAGEDDSSG